MKRLWTIGVLAAMVHLAHAQTDSPATGSALSEPQLQMRSFMFGTGRSNLLETYLSPLEYTGIEIRFSHERIRRTSLFHSKVVGQSLLNIFGSTTQNRAKNNHAYSGMLSWNYNLMYCFQPAEKLKILAGPSLSLNAGVVYNSRNSNNPAQAKAFGNIGASGMVIYHASILHIPVILRYQATLPLLGAMFSPEFGESYYEMFSLKHDGKHVRCTTPFNSPSLTQMLTLDIPVGNAMLRLGSICDIQQARINGLKMHSYSYDCMIGFTQYFSLHKGNVSSKKTPF